MKQNQKMLLVIGLGVVILLNVAIFGWLLTDFFSGPNGSEETVAATGGEEEATAEETTAPEESGSEEETTKEIPAEQIVGEVLLQDAKRVVHTFSWGNGEGQLGYGEKESYTEQLSYPQAFAVENGIICVLDEGNQRVLVYEDGRYSEVKVGTLSESRSLKYQNGWIGVLGKVEEKMITLFCRKDGSAQMSIEIPEKVMNYGTATDILELGETYVIWKVVSKTNSRNQLAYRYDWVDGSLEGMNIPYYDISEAKYNSGVFGEYEGEIYFRYVEEGSSIKVLNQENKNYRLYTKIDDTRYDYIIPQTSEYLSTEGHLYLMEGFIDRVEISELVLDVERAIIVDETETIAPTMEESTEGTSENTGESVQPEWIKAEIPLSDAKKVMYTLPWGDEEGQYGFDESKLLHREFEVESGVVYILDCVNQRVIMFEGTQYSEIDISTVTSPNDMKCENGRIAILDRAKETLVVFREDGSVEAEIKIDRFNLFGYSIEILGIGDTYVEWKLKTGKRDIADRRLRYDWVEDYVEIVGVIEDASAFEELLPYEDVPVVIGRYEEDIYYYLSNWREPQYMLTRQTGEYRLHTTLDCSTHQFDPLWYFTTEGNFYIMEFMQDRVEISELKLEQGIAE